MNPVLLCQETLNEDTINGVVLPIIAADTFASEKPGKLKKIREIFIACMYALAAIIFPLWKYTIGLMEWGNTEKKRIT